MSTVARPTAVPPTRQGNGEQTDQDAAIAAAEAIAAAAAAEIAAEAAGTARAMVRSANEAAARAAVRAQQTARAAADVAAHVAADITVEAAATADEALVVAATAATTAADHRGDADNAADRAADLIAEAAATATAMVLAATAAAARTLVIAERTAEAAAAAAAAVAENLAADAAVTAEAMVVAATAAAVETMAVAAVAAAAQVALRARPAALVEPARATAPHLPASMGNASDPVMPRFVTPGATTSTDTGEDRLWRDISLASRTLAILRETEAEFEAAFDCAPAALLVVSLTRGEPGQFVKVNQALSRLTGRSRIQLLGSGFADLAHPRPSGSAVAGNGRSDALAEIQRWRHRDGRELWVRLHTVKLPHAGAQADRQLVCQVEDITAGIHAMRSAGTRS